MKYLYKYCMTENNFNINSAGNLEVAATSLAFEMPVVLCNNSKTVVDEFNASVYSGARVTATVTNEFNQIEITEFMVIQDGMTAYTCNLSTINNTNSNDIVSQFSVNLIHGTVQIIATCTGVRNQIRLFKLMFKK